MPSSYNQYKYWDKVADKKNFNQAIDWDFLQKELPKDTAILDFGCGYGRLMQELAEHGYINTKGIDISEKMIERGLTKNPELNLATFDGKRIPYKENSFDAVLVFAVLTSIPQDKDQLDILTEIKQVLKPNGLLYVSDLLLNTDERNLARYNEQKEGPYGTFILPEGVNLRHHSKQYMLDVVFNGYNIIHQNEYVVTTMNGNTSNAIQMAGRLIK